jgi:hypothetical protein
MFFETFGHGSVAGAIVKFGCIQIAPFRTDCLAYWSEFLARTDVSEELSASFIRVTRIGEL